MPEPVVPTPIAIDLRDGFAVVIVTADLDLVTEERLSGVLALVTRPVPSSVSLDLSRCGFVGARAFIAIQQTGAALHRAGQTLRVVDPPSSFRILRSLWKRLEEESDPAVTAFEQSSRAACSHCQGVIKPTEEPPVSAAYQAGQCDGCGARYRRAPVGWVFDFDRDTARPAV